MHATHRHSFPSSYLQLLLHAHGLANITHHLPMLLVGDRNEVFLVVTKNVLNSMAKPAPSQLKVKKASLTFSASSGQRITNAWHNSAP